MGNTPVRRNLFNGRSVSHGNQSKNKTKKKTKTGAENESVSIRISPQNLLVEDKADQRWTKMFPVKHGGSVPVT